MPTPDATADQVEEPEAPELNRPEPTPTVEVVSRRDELGLPVEVVEATDALGVQHWDDRLWRHDGPR